MNHTPSKPFSTSARVHPSYLPYMHTSKAKGAKWIPPAVALAAVAGYGVSAYRQAKIDEQHHQTHHAATSDMAAEQRRREAAALLEDAYGDRSSLEGLERAIHVYEAQHQGK